MKNSKFSFTLTAGGINDCCEAIRAYALDAKLSKAETVKLVLPTEEALLAYQSRFGEDTRAILELSARFGKLRMCVSVDGEAYDPLSDLHPFDADYPSVSGLMGSFLTSLKHSYADHVNRISCVRTLERMGGGAKLIVGSVILGFAVGFLSKLLPASFGENLDLFVSLLSDTVMGLIKMAALPVIFLSTIKGIIGSGELATFGRVAKKTISSYVIAMLLLLASVVVMSFLFLPFSYGQATGSSHLFSDVVGVIFSVFPNNIISPFFNSDNVKVLFIAVIIGCAILANKSGVTDSLMGSMTTVCDIASTAMGWLAKPLPLMLFIVIVQNIRDPEMLRDAKKALLLVLIAAAAYLLGVLIDAIIVAKKRSIPYFTLLRAILPPTVKGAVTGSSMMTYPDIEDTLKETLGIDPQFVDFSLPLGLTFFQTSIILFSSIPLYFASVSGVSIDLSWILSLLLLSFLSSFATPPVAGAFLAMLPLIFSSLGVSSAYLPLATSLMMLFDYPTTGLRIAMLILEIARISKNMEKKPS